VPIGVPEPGRDVFAKDKQKEMRSQMIAAQDVSVVDVDEKEISVVAFEPTSAAPEIAAEEKEDVKVQAGDVSATGESEDQARPEVTSIMEKDIEVELGGKDVDDHRKFHGPLDHEEAIADQVAHELYPEARDAE
ncbi:hypothetical protein BDR07DRAFT_1301481, partial [Suillus spraguei]